MKRTFLIALIALTASIAQAQTVNDIFNTVLGGIRKNASGTGANNSTSAGNAFSLNNISSNEVVAALREALQIGAKNASGKLAVTNGYFGNALVKILLPPEARKVETALRSVGMGQMVDKTILSMNRAAEDAAVKAAPIFISAITSMSIQDGVNIVRGGSGAATSYLKSRTTTQLTNAFRPVIQASLSKLNVASLWTQVFSTYNSLPTTFNKVNPDLTGYVTERALSGLFLTIADEENKIRANPAARTTDLLKKVFGAH